MSCFSDFRVGALSEEEFKSAARRECMDSDPFDGYTCHDCSSYKDCCEQTAHLGYPQCDDKDKYFEDEIEVYEAMQDEPFMMATYGCTDSETILRDNSIVDIQADYREWQKV